MAKHINQKNYHTGINLEIMPCFVYEVSINKYWKNGFCVLANKFYKSDKLIEVPDKIRHYDDYIIIREVILLGAPEKFVKKWNT